MNVVSSGGYPPYPIVQIHKQDIELQIKQDPGKLEIEQPKAEVFRQTTPLRMNIQQPQGDLQIDQTRAWDALGQVNNLEMMHRLYRNAEQVFLKGLGKTVDEGNTMAAIHKYPNAIPMLASSERIPLELDVFAAPSQLNVDLHYTAKKPIIDVQESEIHMDVQVNQPRYTHHKSQVNISVLQYPSIKFTPPQIDIQI